MWLEIAVGYGVFLLKLLTVVIGVVVLVGLLVKNKKQETDGELVLVNISEKYQHQQERLQEEFMTDSEFKIYEKSKKRKDKVLKKINFKSGESSEVKQNKLFVIEFEGDLHANEVSALREEISAVIMIAQLGDEVLVKLESPGGSVDGYGLGASQLQRLLDNHIPLTVVVDKVAASGGYMMACVANRIVAAPFSVIGSIGVVAEVPNIHRFLKKHDIDVDVVTAGKFKRTLTFMGENSEEGKQKFQETLETVHELFKSFVLEHRPQLDIELVSTGEFWYGKQAHQLNLIDAIATSDDIILDALKEKEVYSVQYKQKKKLFQRMSEQLNLLVDQIMNRIRWTRVKKW